MASLLPFVNRLEIVTKDLQTVQLGAVMNEAQHTIVQHVDAALAARKRCRLIILKARQLGCSTLVEGLMFTLAMLLENMRGLIIAHENDSSEHLLSMTDHYWSTWFARDIYTAKHKSLKHLSWTETDSRIRIATARNMQAGRSRTIQFLHGSEVAFWEKPRELMTGLAKSIPRTSPSIIIQESTANGVGNYFYDQWNSAIAGDTDFTPLFFPWWKHPEYTAAKLGIGPVTGHLDSDERTLKAFLLTQNLSRAEIDDRLAYRRFDIANDCEGNVLKFMQEMPAHPDEAFISSGNNVFPDQLLQDCYESMAGRTGYLVEEAGQRIRFQESIDGPLKIFRFPGALEVSRYAIGIDAAKGVKGDYAVMQVMNRKSWEQVAVFRTHMDPATLGEQAVLLGRYYNWAILCPEVGGGGESTIGVILHMNYPHVWKHQKAERDPGFTDNTYGWWASTRAKIEAVGYLLRGVVDRDITIHDHQTFVEMRAFEDKGGGAYGNSSETGHDDTVTALAITMAVVFYEAMELASGMTPWVPGQTQERATVGGLTRGGAGVRGTVDVGEGKVAVGGSGRVPDSMREAVARAQGYAPMDDDGGWD